MPENLIAHTGVQEQARNKTEALKEIEKINFLETNPSLLEEKLLKVIELDNLSAFAWFNLGIIQSTTNRPDNACFSFVLASLLNLQDVESWVNAALLSINTSANLFQTVVNVAYFHNEEVFFVELYRQLSLTIKEKKLLANAVNTINQVLKTINDKEIRKNSKVRLMKEDEIFE